MSEATDPKPVVLTDAELDALTEAGMEAVPNRALVAAMVDDIVPALASIVGQRETAARSEGEADAANAFVKWAMVNEIAEPPLDWAWFGEIARRYSPLHEEYQAEEQGA